MADSQEVRPLLLSQAVLSWSNYPAKLQKWLQVEGQWDSRTRPDWFLSTGRPGGFPCGEGSISCITQPASVRIAPASLPYLPLLGMGLLERHQEGEGINRYIMGFSLPSLDRDLPHLHVSAAEPHLWLPFGGGEGRSQPWLLPSVTNAYQFRKFRG